VLIPTSLVVIPTSPILTPKFATAKILRINIGDISIDTKDLGVNTKIEITVFQFRVYKLN
jgi:hypothetical protein